ncbi:MULTISPECIES: hypothetical protein [unclassified Nostoc]|nr:hypothetical protein [Nostoc sp. 'Peltigera membranacea cyanobiont' 213]
MFMGFAAIAIGISIDAECPRPGYAYAPEICSIKTPTMNSISPN